MQKGGRRELGTDMKWVTLLTLCLHIHLHSSTNDSKNAALYGISHFESESRNMLFPVMQHFESLSDNCSGDTASKESPCI